MRFTCKNLQQLGFVIKCVGFQNTISLQWISASHGIPFCTVEELETHICLYMYCYKLSWVCCKRCWNSGLNLTGTFEHRRKKENRNLNRDFLGTSEASPTISEGVRYSDGLGQKDSLNPLESQWSCTLCELHMTMEPRPERGYVALGKRLHILMQCSKFQLKLLQTSVHACQP